MVENVGSFQLCVELFKTGSEVVLLDDLTVSLTSIDVSATGMHIAILFYIEVSFCLSSVLYYIYRMHRSM